MQKESRAIAFACFLGAVIGAFIALEVSERFSLGSYLWVAGIPVGGLVGYIAYDLKGFALGVAQAWRDVIAYRPNWQWWRATATYTFYSSLVYSTMALLIPFLVAPAMQDPISNYFTYVKPFLLLLFWPLSVMFSISVCWEASEEGLARGVREMRRMSLYGNPIVFPFFCLYWIGRGLLFVAGHIPNAMTTTVRSTKLTGRFIRRVFVNVHSDERLLCLVDASFGVVIGYFFGSALLGGVAGAVFGVANYEILSVRILKLVPVRQER